MKQVYALVCGLGAFFAMNCGSGEGLYGSGSSEGQTQQPAASSNDKDKDATGTPSSGATVVKILGHSFDPPELKIKAGTTVRWTWSSGGHNVVSGAGCSADGAFTSGDNLSSKGATYEHTFTEAGSFPYFCDPHCGMGMKGTIVVE